MNETPSQTIGPFFRFGLDWMEATDLVAPGAAGARELSGRVFDGEGLEVPDAMIEIWQPPRFGRCLTAADGSYRFTIARPEKRGDGQAPHLSMSVFARGLLHRLVTRVYFPDHGEANAADPLLAAVPGDRRDTLLAVAEPHCLRFDIHLQGPRETIFLAY
jgi:protocatechuate 3,4-dioxygenase alpha subunit